MRDFSSNVPGIFYPGFHGFWTSAIMIIGLIYSKTIKSDELIMIGLLKKISLLQNCDLDTRHLRNLSIKFEKIFRNFT